MSFSVPICDLRTPRGRLCTALLLLLPACTAGEPSSETRDAGVTLPPLSDGGVRGGSDASTADAGPALGGGERDFATDACWNGLDDNEDGISDCADVGCSVTPFCCLGSSSAGCCGDARSLALDFASGCTGADPLSCHPSALAFGAPLPIVEDSALVPNGGAISDAGLTLAEPLDGTRERIVIRAELAAPIGGCRECLDAIGVGVSGPIAGDVVAVVPDVAVLLRAARGDYALVVGGEIIAAVPLVTDAPRPYVLTLTPDGAVELRVEGDDPIEARWYPAPGRQLVVYGRTHNRPASAPPPARALSVEARTDACEIPSSLARAPAPLFDDALFGDARAPSVVIDGEDALVAFERGGAIYLARRDDSGAWIPSAGPALEAPVNEAYRDPELARAADRWVLFVTHERDGTRAIARAESTDGGETFGAPLDLPSPSTLSQPAFARIGGRDVIAALATSAGDLGAGGIVLLELAADELRWLEGTQEASTVVRPAGGIHAFDADEVAAPALYVDSAGIVRVYYAGRRGARWSIGIRAAGLNGPFSYAPEEPVLEPSGEGVDALGVSDPSVAREGDALHLYHTALDGLRARIGRASGGTRW